MINIFEAFSGRSDILKQIDQVFKRIQDDFKGNKKQGINELTMLLKQFTDIKRIRIRIEKDLLNASVIPSYHSFLPILEKKFKQKDNITTIQESADHIDRIYIILGDKLFTTFSNKELTAILLHELGHVFQHNSHFPSLIKFFLKLGTSVTSIVSLPFYWIQPIVSSSLVITCWIISRTLFFFEHMGEYEADKFAAKYGYGEEIITIMNKFKSFNKKDNTTWLTRLFDQIKYILFPSSHPLDNNRICKLINKLQNEYIEMYPKLSSDISLVLSDVKCPM